MSDGLVGSAPPRDVAPATFLSHYMGLYLGEERCVRMAMIHVDEILCLTILLSFFFGGTQAWLFGTREGCGFGVAPCGFSVSPSLLCRVSGLRGASK